MPNGKSTHFSEEYRLAVQKLQLEFWADRERRETIVTAYQTAWGQFKAEGVYHQLIKDMREASKHNR
jgi:hypothetical protein